MWFWTVTAAGAKGFAGEIFLGQDVGLCAPNLNEAYVSQYLDHRAVEEENGFHIITKQNQWPDLILRQGSLTGEMCIRDSYRSFDRFWSKYGFRDAYNLDHGAEGWFAKDIIGIDKGISTLMIENYISGMIWKIYHENKYVKAGLKKLGFREVRS